MTITQSIELVAECGDYILYRKPKTSVEWLGFVLQLKFPKWKRTRFDLGWNGTRFANAEALNRLLIQDKNAVNWALNILRSEYPKVDSDIERVASQLRIPYLVHFTNEKNLSSILEIGLQPKQNSEKYKFFPAINDALRLDGHMDAISLSIGFPNSKMFYKYRKQSEEESWAVLVIDRSVLWKRKCAFCKNNAASSQISSKSPDELSSHQALLEMYEDMPNPYSRAGKRLHEYDPTDVQAEVLVFGVIPKH